VIIDGVNFPNNADVEMPAARRRSQRDDVGGRHAAETDSQRTRIYVWKFHVDWNDPARASAVPRRSPPPSLLCGGQLTNCVPQPDTERRLDAQGDIMQRLVYRNVGGRGSIVAVHSGHGGRRRSRALVHSDRRKRDVTYQQGTYAPDRFYRWMASPAIDRRNNIAIGYSFGGSPKYPEQRIAAACKRSPGVLTFRETVSSRRGLSNLGRWEDYTRPRSTSDDCTIW
jgi:hypothetical protein